MNKENIEHMLSNWIDRYSREIKDPANKNKKVKLKELKIRRDECKEIRGMF